jgi:hypothetical protein
MTAIKDTKKRVMAYSRSWVMKWAGDSDDYKARKPHIDIAHKTKANSDTFLILL